MIDNQGLFILSGSPTAFKLLKENLLFGRGTKAGYDRPLDNKS